MAEENTTPARSGSIPGRGSWLALGRPASAATIAPTVTPNCANRLSRESQGRSAGSWCRDRSNSLARDTTRLRSPIRSISGSALRQDSPAVLFRQNCVLPTPLGAMMPTPVITTRFMPFLRRRPADGRGARIELSRGRAVTARVAARAGSRRLCRPHHRWSSRSAVRCQAGTDSSGAAHRRSYLLFLCSCRKRLDSADLGRVYSSQTFLTRSLLRAQSNSS